MRNQAIVEQFALAIQSQAKELPAPLRRYLESLTETYHYDNIELLDTSGRQLAALNRPAALSPQASALIAPALQQGRVLHTELYTDPDGRLHMEFIIPLRVITSYSIHYTKLYD